MIRIAASCCLIGVVSWAVGAPVESGAALSRVEVARQGGAHQLRFAGGAVFHESPVEPRNVREIRADGAMVVVWDEEDAVGGGARTRYAISRDGVSVLGVGEASYRLGLVPGGFDPLAGVPGADAMLSADGGERLFIVQFVTPPIDEYFAELDRLGAERFSHLPKQAYVVRMSDAARGAVERLPFVRWVGAYHPHYRLDDVSRLDALSAERGGGARRYNIMLGEKSAAAKFRAGFGVLASGGIVDNPDAGARLIEATLTPEQLRRLARHDDVLFIDRWSPPETDMNLAMQFSGGMYVRDTLGLRGEGVRAEVVDDGLRLTHGDFSPAPVIHGTGPDTQSHGSSTYGINFGDGVNCQVGILPDATGIIGDYHVIPNHYTHLGQLVNPAFQWQGVYQSNSWGSGPTINYTTISADMDDSVFDHDIAVFRSQGNIGTTDSRPQAWAKNVISVGGLRHRNTLTVGDDCWCGTASIGPAADGRFKPDLAHFNDLVATTSGSSDTACTTSFGGTSSATPITAGHSGLWFQLWHMGVFRNTPGATVFESRPHASLTKAMLIATADQWAFSGTGHDLARVHQGWGRVNVRNLYDERESIFWVNEEDVLTPLQSREYRLAVPAGQPMLKVVLSYKDPAGSPAVQSQHRVNDLDLTVIAPNGVATFLGNVGLDVGVWSATGGAADSKNTVECVFVEAPIAGTWTIRVSATELNQDSHVQTPALDADFALVVRGVDPELVPLVCSGDADGDRAVGLSDIALMVSQWAQSVKPLTQGDLTGDGVVDLADLSVVILFWGNACPPVN